MASEMAISTDPSFILASVIICHGPSCHRGATAAAEHFSIKEMRPAAVILDAVFDVLSPGLKFCLYSIPVFPPDDPFVIVF